MSKHQQIQQSKKPDTIFQKQSTPTSQTPVLNPYSIIQRAKINPKSLTHADIMQLQRTIGNKAVGRLLTGIGNASTAQQVTVQRQEIPEEEEPLQGKMIETIQRQEIPEEEEPLQGKMMGTIQRQEIPEEEEPLQGKFENKPETVCPSCFATPIMQRQEVPEEEEPLQGKMIGTIQRQEIPEEEEPLQGKMAETVQRQEIPEEEEPLQGKMIQTIQRQEIPEEEEPLQGKMAETIQRQEIPEEEEPLQKKRENNTGMPDNLKAGVENLSGIDMSDVRVHYNSDKPADVGALAYTQGTDIHVAPGQERHLPHEAWHVVQQAQGRVKPTFQMKGVAVNNDEKLEREADEMGAKMARVGDSATPFRLSEDRAEPDEMPYRQPASSLSKMKNLNFTPFIQGKLDAVRGIENNENMKEPLQMTRGKSRKQVRDRKKLERKHINERFQGSRRKGMAENTNTAIANGVIRRKSHNFTTRSGGGAFLIGGTLHGYDESKMPWAGKEQIETWPFLNCAEAKMYLHIIELGGSPSMFEITSLDEQGKIHSPCRNCRQWVYDVFGKVNPPRDKIERYLHPDEQ